MSENKAPRRSVRFDILSLFPESFRGPFDESILKRARQEGLIEINLVDIRQFADNKWKKVDDRPYGGGPGMVMMAAPVAAALRSVAKPGAVRIYLSPQGRRLTADLSRHLASYDHLILLCGHYEGVDERVLDSDIDEEISIGDYVLTNGCLPAMVLVDAVARFIPGVLGDETAANQDSFEVELEGMLDCPHYTRPEQFEGKQVPPILLSGNHREIKIWRQEQRRNKTRKVRPDLLDEEK